jgi:glyoxylase-like metal-dependent hydrolase (beta-lactamase superfamily II)
VLHERTGEPWHGFAAVRGIEGLPPELLLVPLGGHSRGHQGIAVDTGRGWLLHTGDLYMHRGRMEEAPWSPPGLAFFERIIAHDHAQVVANQARVRALARERGDVRVFSAHDAHEFAAMAAGSA